MSPGVRDYLAAERTLLAWIRTGLALMGLGFVVARFGMVLQSYGPSLALGAALIVAGVLVNVLSGWHHMQTVKAIDSELGGERHSTTLAVAAAGFLALVGTAMAACLVLLSGSTNLQAAISEERVVTFDTHNGIIDTPSHHSVDATVETLREMLQSKGVTVFAVVDHSGEAEKAGLKMPPTKLLIFGSPKAGTPLMLAAPRTAIDLPLKILVWQDRSGQVWISYNSPQYLQERHGFPTELLRNIAVVSTLAAKAAE
jgi:uncharacterized protein (DUF302 family)/uncharacterized membrane protein YidH (DUF202 family)